MKLDIYGTEANQDLISNKNVDNDIRMTNFDPLVSHSSFVSLLMEIYFLLGQATDGGNFGPGIQIQ